MHLGCYLNNGSLLEKGLGTQGSLNDRYILSESLGLNICLQGLYILNCQY